MSDEPNQDSRGGQKLRRITRKRLLTPEEGKRLEEERRKEEQNANACIAKMRQTYKGMVRRAAVRGQYHAKDQSRFLDKGDYLPLDLWDSVYP